MASLNSNFVWLGDGSLVVTGLWAEYFATTNLSGGPVRANWESPVNFAATNGWPEAPVPTNVFSTRWSGILEPQVQGEHVFYVNADAGAAIRLWVNGATIIDHWANPGTNATELAGTNWLGTNFACDLRLEYAHGTNPARVSLSWKEPGMGAKEVIPAGRFVSTNAGPTGISVDAAGKIWAACYNSSSAVRIDPAAGPLVVVDDGTNQVTNHVGLVDTVVSLGDGSFHTGEYTNPAAPYNYSDMTGANGRVVNPGGQPLKGYWTVIHDSGRTNEFWQRVSWAANLPIPGCGIEVWVRASDDRIALASEPFLAVSNDVAFTAVNGRFIEVRVALTRDDASKQPVLYDLTLQGLSSTFDGEASLPDAGANETQDAVFSPLLSAPGPVTYQWFVQYPWMPEWEWTLVPGVTNHEFVITNVDSWVGGYVDGTYNRVSTWAKVFVTDATGESFWIGPAELWVTPSAIAIPATNYSSDLGPAARYPATIHVFGQPTNFNSVSVAVSLWGLSHDRSADLDVLLVSPRGTNIMLMSHVGGTNAVYGADLVFQQPASSLSESNRILSGVYEPNNYGRISQLPQVGPVPPPSGAYSTNLYDLGSSDPNGVWRLYVCDDGTNKVGQLLGSWECTGVWQLHFFFQ